MKFISNAKVWFTLSTMLVLLSVVALGINKAQTGSFLHYGIDFTGGTLIEFETLTEKTVEDVQASLVSYEEEYRPIVQTSGEGSFIVKMKTISNETHDEIVSTLKTNLTEFEETRFITIGSAVGKTMKERALWALAVALVAIVLFIAFAFREVPKELSAWKFGFAAIIALAHDVFITIGIFAVLGLTMGVEIDLLFITALLTVMGFSVHDTIVVFDRLRENVRFARPTETFEDIGEKSIQQTLARSINTSVSTLFPLLTLFFFGAESIQFFVLALIIGIVIGTYSSIFLATPVLVYWQGKDKSDLRRD